MDNVVLKPRVREGSAHGHTKYGVHIVHGEGRTPLSSPPPVRRKKKRGSLVRGAVVTIGAMLLTVAVIKANDTFNAPNGQLAGVAGSAKDARCPSDMTFVSDSGGGFCIDIYEASASKDCPFPDPQNQLQSNNNLSQPLCTPVSAANALPWTNIPESQAMELCARAGKHLTKNAEWYRAALGTPDDSSGSTESCVLGRTGASHAENTGVHSRCASSAGAYDMVGNVWEWVDANVSAGSYLGRTLPGEGYVAEVDVDGVPTETATSAQAVFHGDYAYLKADGVYGMMRGGFWNLTDKAGPASINATIPTSFIGAAVGFRCAR